MESVKALGQLRRVVRIVAVTLGISVTLAVPGGFGTVSYLDQAAATAFRAKLAADRLSAFAYVHGPTWVYSNHRVPELIGELDPGGETRQTVLDAQGRTIYSIGGPLSAVTYSASHTITDGGQSVGAMIVETDLWPFVEQLSMVALLGALLGLGVYLGVELIPLRAVREASTRLERAERELRAEVARTELALHDTQRERARAEEANRAKSEFVANMSHEFRTPLNAIIGFSDMLRHRMFGDLSDRYRGYADDIHFSGLHLLAIVNDILDIAKIESGQLELQREPVDPRLIVEDAVKVVAEGAAKAGIQLSVIHGDDLPDSVMLDRVKIRQILLNLLSNAVKFTPGGGRVGVFLLADATAIMIEIADTGVGMTDAELETALKPFGQVAGAYTRDHRGTGLGLPIANALVHQHQGSMVINSQAGRGTTVTIRLPVVDPEPGQA